MNRHTKTQQADKTLCKRVGCTHKLGLAGQTYLVPRHAAELGDPPTVIVTVGEIGDFFEGADCRTHYFAVAIEETGESFWWDMDEAKAIAIPASPGLVALPLCTATEYESPRERPFNYPFHLSPLKSVGWEWQNLKVVRTNRGRSFRPGWHMWGNLHPSGGETQ